jgi:hypothetical protein
LYRPQSPLLVCAPGARHWSPLCRTIAVGDHGDDIVGSR